MLKAFFYKIKPQFIKLLLIILFGSYLTACTTKKIETPKAQVYVPTPEENWTVHKSDLQKINTFQVKGSMAYLSDKTKHYARFFLDQQSSTNYSLKLTTPLGGTVLNLISKPNYAELIDKEGKKYRDQNVELLLKKLTGMNIPLKSLHNWLLGFSNNPVYDKINDKGQLKESQLEQNDIIWFLNITSYTTKDVVPLPAQVELSNEKERIRLKISDWVL